MVNPDLLRKGDWVLFGATGEWLEVDHLPWFTGDPGGEWKIGVWHYENDRRWLYTPASLRGVVVLVRDGVEIWNAATALEQQALLIE